MNQPPKVNIFIFLTPESELREIAIGEIRVIDRFSLGWLSGDHTPFQDVCVLITYYCMVDVPFFEVAP